MKKKNLLVALILLFILVGIYTIRFYPTQMMPVGEPIAVLTPDPSRYHNDCLHPCVRQLDDGTYVMVQSPYYKWDNKVENPMFYRSASIRSWDSAALLSDTPEYGFNSDPNLYVEDTLLYVFWRENDTPLCTQTGGNTLIGGALNGHDEIQQHKQYIVSGADNVETGICPILLKHQGKYYFYCTWYRLHPERKNNGIAIWEGTSLENPDFVLTDTIQFDNPLVCDKWLQMKLFGHIWYLPKPLRYDLWHFDLFEYGGKLYMVSSAEKNDNIMLSVSEDWKHFKTFKKPLINNHYTENYIGYRQYYYKPTAIVQNYSLYLFYTGNAADDRDRNQLYLSVKALRDLGI